jgi:hypothetical protein
MNGLFPELHTTEGRGFESLLAHNDLTEVIEHTDPVPSFLLELMIARKTFENGQTFVKRLSNQSSSVNKSPAQNYRTKLAGRMIEHRQGPLPFEGEAPGPVPTKQLIHNQR